MRIGTPKPLYRAIATELERLQRGKREGKPFADSAEDSLVVLEGLLPSGSGVDSGTRVDRDCDPTKYIKLHLSYHHMNDGGYYDGWTDHTVTVRPSLMSDYDLSISGRDRNDIKDYLHDLYHSSLQQQVTPIYNPLRKESGWFTPSQLAAHNTAAYYVSGNYGTLTVNADGWVIAYNPGDNDPEYADIVRFDLEEYRKQYGKNPGAGTTDICDIGFWTENGKYEGPVEDYRKRVAGLLP